MDTKHFTKLIRQHFSPFIREQGFKGSGNRYTKLTDEHYVFALKFMANKYGGECCIDLAVHLDFLPDGTGEVVVPNKVDPWACDFRVRLAPGGLETNTWWTYGDTEEHALDSILDMKEKFIKWGLPYFEQFKDFPEPFSSIDIEELEKPGNYKRGGKLYNLGVPTDIRLAMRIAQVHMFIGDYAKAKLFAEWGRKKITGFRGSGMIPILEDIIEKSSVN